MYFALPILSSLLYAAAGALVARALFARQGEETVAPPRAANLAGAGAVALHGAVLYQDVVTEAGLNLGFFNAASLTTWVIAVLVLLAALRRPVAALGLLSLPLAAVTVLLGRFVATGPVLLGDLGAGVQTHVATSVLAASVLSIAAFQAIVVYVQERRLRSRRPGHITRVLPPLQLQEVVLVQLLALGFFLLSLSLVTGLVFVQNLLGQHLVHKTVLACSAWLVFAVLLYGRWRHGWRGRTLIRWTLGGFITLMLAYFGAKLVLEVVLGQTWTAL